jgi:hypothetical protein
VVMSPAELGPENDFAGETQQQLQMTDPSSRQRGCYIRTTAASVQLENEVTGRESRRAYGSDELIGGKQPVVK